MKIFCLLFPILLFSNLAHSQNYLRFFDQYGRELEDTTKVEYQEFEIVQIQNNVVSLSRYLRDSTLVSVKTTLLDSAGNYKASNERKFFPSGKTMSLERVDKEKEERHLKTYHQNGELQSESLTRGNELVHQSHFDPLGNEVAPPQLTLPSPKGGLEGWNNYLASELQYPQVARTIRAEGTIIVAFTLDEEGTARSFDVLNKGQFHHSLEKEALRVIEKYPHRWVPAKMDGVPVESPMRIPIAFRLN
jgi:TonB family protein